MAQWIKAQSDGTPTMVAPQNGKKFTLQELQRMVGGYIEPIRMGRQTMLVNEDGLALGLPPNRWATSRVQQQAPQYLWDGAHKIVGDVIIVDPGEW